MKNQVNWFFFFGTSVVKVGALIGIVAWLVDGSTLYHPLKLPVQKDGVFVNMPLLTGNYLRVMRQLWHNIECIFTDQISMIPYEMLCMIDSHLWQFKIPNDFFGGINVSLFGDLMQLSPVWGHKFFNKQNTFVAAVQTGWT